MLKPRLQELNLFDFIANCEEPYPYGKYLRDCFQTNTDSRVWLQRDIASILSCEFTIVPRRIILLIMQSSGTRPHFLSNTGTTCCLEGVQFGLLLGTQCASTRSGTSHPSRGFRAGTRCFDPRRLYTLKCALHQWSSSTVSISNTLGDQGLVRGRVPAGQRGARGMHRPDPSEYPLLSYNVQCKYQSPFP